MGIRAGEMAFLADEGVLALERGSSIIMRCQRTIQENPLSNSFDLAGKPVLMLNDQSTFRFVLRRHAGSGRSQDHVSFLGASFYESLLVSTAFVRRAIAKVRSYRCC